MQNAPILIFCYKRLLSLQQTIGALQKCKLAPQSDLYIFSDGAKHHTDVEKVNEIRSYIKSVTGFQKVIIKEAKKNKGLATSIIEGVSEVIKNSERVIVLEDDLVVSPNFLSYMNECLGFYDDNSGVFSIAGYTIPMEAPENYQYDAYFLPRASSWGWGTWQSRWEGIDWQVSDFEQFSNDKKQISAFNQGGSDMFAMLKKQMTNKLDSWAIRWCYHQFKVGSLTVFPVVSKVQNIGFTSDATNTHVYNRYYTTLDKGDLESFKLPSEVRSDPFFLKQFQTFYNIRTRIVSKIKTYLLKARLTTND